MYRNVIDKKKVYNNINIITQYTNHIYCSIKMKYQQWLEVQTTDEVPYQVQTHSFSLIPHSDIYKDTCDLK